MGTELPALDASKFPGRLKEARQLRKLTMKAAGALVGLTSKQAYQAYEVGRVVPQLGLCERFADALKVGRGWLAGWDDSPRSTLGCDETEAK